MKAKIRVGAISYYDIEIDSDDWGDGDFSEIDLSEACEDFERWEGPPDDGEYATPQVMVDGQWQEPLFVLLRDNSFGWRIDGETFSTMEELLRAKAVVMEPAE